MNTDAELQRDVIAELNWSPSINATHIGVEVDEGVVTLSGHVASYVEKWNAERAALRVRNVKALAVNIEVKLPSLSQRDDTDISKSISSVLQHMTQLHDSHIKIIVEKGWVTLTGEVEWDYQRQAATRMVRHMMGVTGASNNIAIKPKVSMSTVKESIDTAIKRRALNDMHSISVAVLGADVTLSGKVHSWSERELARHAAWCIPGVHQVIDKITVI
ncbi:BON domain-containing protein [Neisseriaceae bacterium TC5R-5]|nr:BON domain-containing protein [Neisseriaceae bacterium TC5R-5]